MDKEKIVIVTGGSRGIGKEISRVFLERGDIVIIIYAKNRKAVDDFKNSLPNKVKKKLFSYCGFIHDELFLKKVFSEIKEKFGRIDILVNNAGITKDNLFLNMSKNEWRDVLNINLRGTFIASLAGGEIMKQNPHGSSIINISSLSGVFGRIGQANYACSKGGIIGLTRLFAKIYEKDNIHVNAVAPGFIETDMAGKVLETAKNEVIGVTNTKRMGLPKEVANTVLFLANEKGNYISGSVIKVDGGYLR